MKLRDRNTPSAAPRKRLSIVVDMNQNPATPLPVKINHVHPASAALHLLAR